jgi:hypothetical protein
MALSTHRERATAHCRIGFQPVFLVHVSGLRLQIPWTNAVAGDALPDRKQAGSLFYIGLQPVERHPKVSPARALVQGSGEVAEIDLEDNYDLELTTTPSNNIFS